MDLARLGKSIKMIASSNVAVKPPPTVCQSE
jgi:hypothetical protein